MQIAEMLDLVPEQAMARKMGVSPGRLAKLRHREDSRGLWRHAFGAYMWLESAREKVQALMMQEAIESAKRRSKKGATAAEASAPASVTSSAPPALREDEATLVQLRSRERRLYLARNGEGAILVQTHRLHPLGSRVRVVRVDGQLWREL